jgi:hypothetical protein
MLRQLPLIQEASLICCTVLGRAVLEARRGGVLVWFSLDSSDPWVPEDPALTHQ